ncbi:MAG TPA: methionyl-tRNA formyltransferase [Sumerlaeia bacterium]|nr:methionyl-tRNA formyltransferase [Sumerlaeia bacterium]
MRIVFMGTPLFAVPSLERLIESSHEVLLAVTQPDRGAGRGRPLRASPVKELVAANGIEVLQPERIRDNAEFLRRLAERAPDLIVVVAYGLILPPSALALPRLGTINLHASLLPRYRGAAPVNWAIINGETRTGVTIMQVDEGMDTGPILSQEEVPILEDDDAPSLSGMLSVVGSHALLAAINGIEVAGKIEGSPQDESQASYARMLKKEDGRIDWSRGTDELVRRVRGTAPWPGAFTESESGPLKILKAEPLWPEAMEAIEDRGRIPPGTVSLALASHGFAVRTGDGFLLVTQAQPAGGKALSGADIVNGRHIKPRDRLGEA